MRARLQCLQQSRTATKAVLAFVSEGWKRACQLEDEVKALQLNHITEVTIVADEILCVKTILLRRDTKSKLVVRFRVCVSSLGGEDKGTDKLGLHVNVEREAKVVYGKGDCGEAAIKEFLKRKGEGGWGWDGAVRALEGKMGRSGNGKGKVVKGR